MNLTGEKLGAPTYLEAASAAKLRGLPVPHEWAEIENFARQLASATGAAPYAVRAQCPQLMAAARALDAIAQGAPAGGAVARERGVWAAAAMAAGGNFPGARVVIARTFPARASASRCSHGDAVVRTFAVASLRSARSQTPLAGALDALFAGADLRRVGRFRCDRKRGLGAAICGSWCAPDWKRSRGRRRLARCETRSCPQDSWRG